MNAICRCINKHLFTSKIVADEPDVNYFEVTDSECPECGTDDFEIIDEDTGD